MQARQIERRVEALEAKVLPPARSAAPSFIDANLLAYLKGAIGTEAAERAYEKVLDAATITPFDAKRLNRLSASELSLVEQYLELWDVVA
jgi:hypothetical protein